MRQCRANEVVDNCHDYQGRFRKSPLPSLATCAILPCAAADIPLQNPKNPTKQMAAKKNNPAMDFIVEHLQKNRGAQYKDIKEAAEKKKLDIYPIMYGRAQAMLGIVKSRPRGQGKTKAAAAAATGAPVKRGPGRPRKNAAPSFGGSLESIVAAVKSSEDMRSRYRSALEKIQGILAGVL